MPVDEEKMLNEFYENATREELIFMLQVAKIRDEDMRPQKVSIEPAERVRIEELLRAFGPYIQGHDYFDIMLSSKFGVICMDVDGNFDYYCDADSLFLKLLSEINGDIRALCLGGQHMTPHMRPGEAGELRRRVMPLIEQLQDSQHYAGLLEEVLEKYRDEND